MIIPTAVFALLASSKLARTPTLGPGSPAPPLEVKAWLKGKEISQLESDQTYVVEFWATWCGPCIDGIPHLTKIAQTMRGRVSVIGVSIWEGADGSREKLQKFVDSMGEKMDYHVAMGGDREGMAISWMKAANRGGIPCAFIVKNHQIQWIGHPMALDKPLEEVVDGSFDLAAAKAAFEKSDQKARKREAGQSQIEAIQKQYKAGQRKAARIALDKLVREDATFDGQAVGIKLNWDAIENPSSALQQLERIAKTGTEDATELVCTFALEGVESNSPTAKLAEKAILLAQQHLKGHMITHWYSSMFYQTRKEYSMALKYVDKAISMFPESSYKDQPRMLKILKSTRQQILDEMKK